MSDFNLEHIRFQASKPHNIQFSWYHLSELHREALKEPPQDFRAFRETHLWPNRYGHFAGGPFHQSRMIIASTQSSQKVGNRKTFEPVGYLWAAATTPGSHLPSRTWQRCLQAIGAKPTPLTIGEIVVDREYQDRGIGIIMTLLLLERMNGNQPVSVVLPTDPETAETMLSRNTLNAPFALVTTVGSLSVSLLERQGA